MALPRVCAALRLPPFAAAALAGLVTSAGGLSESVVRGAAGALRGALAAGAPAGALGEILLSFLEARAGAGVPEARGAQAAQTRAEGAPEAPLGDWLAGVLSAGGAGGGGEGGACGGGAGGAREGRGGEARLVTPALRTLALLLAEGALAAADADEGPPEGAAGAADADEGPPAGAAGAAEEGGPAAACVRAGSSSASSGASFGARAVALVAQRAAGGAGEVSRTLAAAQVYLGLLSFKRCVRARAGGARAGGAHGGSPRLGAMGGGGRASSCTGPRMPAAWPRGHLRSASLRESTRGRLRSASLRESTRGHLRSASLRVA